MKCRHEMIYRSYVFDITPEEGLHRMKDMANDMFNPEYQSYPMKKMDLEYNQLNYEQREQAIQKQKDYGIQCDCEETRIVVFPDYPISYGE